MGSFGPTCPYCHEPLRKTPKRKTNCPSCAQPIFVRSKQDFLPGTLLTGEEARSVDLLTKLEVGPAEFAKYRQELAKEFGVEPAASDIVWRICNSRTPPPYFLMAMFVAEEGREFHYLLREHHRLQLDQWSRLYRNGLPEPERIKVSVIGSGPGSCPACQMFAGTTLTLEDALHTMPLPVRGCTHELREGIAGWCRCCYGLLFED